MMNQHGVKPFSRYYVEPDVDRGHGDDMHGYIPIEQRRERDYDRETQTHLKDEL